MLIQEIAGLLIALRVADDDGAVVTGWRLFECVLPDEPDHVVALFPAGGGQAEPKTRIRRPRFQVRVRGAVHESCRAPSERLDAVHRVLNGFSGVLDGVRYVGIVAASDQMAMGQDARGRHEVTQTFIATRSDSE